MPLVSKKQSRGQDPVSIWPTPLFGSASAKALHSVQVRDVPSSHSEFPTSLIEGVHGGNGGVGGVGSDEIGSEGGGAGGGGCGGGDGRAIHNGGGGEGDGGGGEGDGGGGEGDGGGGEGGDGGGEGGDGGGGAFKQPQTGHALLARSSVMLPVLCAL